MEDLYDKKEKKADFKMAIKNGKFYTYLGNTKPEDMDSVEELTTEAGSVYYARVGEAFTGKLNNVEITVKDFKGKPMEILNLHMVKGERKITVEFPFSSKYGRSFMYRLAGIKPEQDLTLEPYSFKDKEGKDVIGISVLQGGLKLPSLYTKEAPNGMPAPKTVTINNQTQYDWTDSIQFQLKLIAEYNAKIKATKTDWDNFSEPAGAPVEVPTKKAAKKSEPVVETTNESNDLPF